MHKIHTFRVIDFLSKDILIMSDEGLKRLKAFLRVTDKDQEIINKKNVSNRVSHER